jgi:DNA-binding MarR family transcriptional regulator
MRDERVPLVALRLFRPVRPIWPLDSRLDNIRLNRYFRAVTSPIARQLKQRKAFASPEQEAMLGIRMVAARILAPWERFLASEADLTTSQYNVLRILRGSHPKSLTAGEIGERTIAREPDITRLVDRLDGKRLVKRTRSEHDRRVVEVEITEKGLDLLRRLDPHAQRMPRALIGHVGPRRLRQLSKLLGAVLDGMGTYP